MGRLIIALLVVMIISGCTTHQTRATVVKVPIVVCPIPEYIVDPILPIDLLRAEDNGDWEKIAKSYAASIVRLEAHNETLKAQLQVYRDTRGETE